MSIGKNSINRVAEGIDSENAAPMTAEIPSVELERTIVEGTKDEAEKPAKKPAKKPAAKKTTAKKAAKKPAAKKKEEKKEAPELVGQAAAAPRRGRKPGSKNKKPYQRKTVRPAAAFGKVAIGEALPVYLL